MADFELVLQFRNARVETEDEIGEIEDALFEILDDTESWTGHEVLAGARNIVIATGDPAATFARMLPFLRKADLLAHLTAAARPVAGGTYTTLWPQGHAFART